MSQQWNSVSVLPPAVPTAQKPPPPGTLVMPNSQSPPAPGLGLAAVVHAVPFQCSASVRNAAPTDARRAPTAQALCVPVAATAWSELKSLPGLAAGTTDQPEPVHRSASARVWLPLR